MSHSSPKFLEDLNSRVKARMFGWSVGPVAVVATALSLLLLRLWNLEAAPPGFYSDEMNVAANTVCLRHTGVDLWGNGWSFGTGGPVNARGYVLGFTGHTHMLASVWFVLAGDSIAAARSFAVLISLVIVACATGIAYNFVGRSGAVWALGLSAVSPWTWTLSRVGFLTDFGNMHLFIGLWLLTRHVRRRDDPRIHEVVVAGLLFGVSLWSPYSTFATGFSAIVFSLYLLRQKRLPGATALFWTNLAASYAVWQFSLGKFSNTRIGQMAIFDELAREQTVLNKVTALVRICWNGLFEYLSLDFWVFKGDTNLRHHSGWGGQLSWPQILLVALSPIAVVIAWRIRLKLTGVVNLLTVSAIGIIGGLLTTMITGEGPHANRLLVAAPFFVLGCVAIGMTLTPYLKFLPVMCVVLGVSFFSFFLQDYFSDYPVRADGWFQSDIRREGEIARRTGDFSTFYSKKDSFIAKYGLLAKPGLIFFEAAGSGKGCPGYGK